MVSSAPFAPPLTTLPQTPPSLSASSLSTPPANTVVRTFDIRIKKSGSTNVDEKEIAHIDWHELDGAECCDKGSSVGGIEPAAFQIIPLLPVYAPSPKLQMQPAAEPNSDHISRQTSTIPSSPIYHPTIIKHPADKTCHRCGLQKGSSVHHHIHPNLTTYISSPTNSRPGHCISTFVPDIEAAAVCPDIESPTSPNRDPNSDPFEVFMEHERHHNRQGSSHLRVASMTAEDYEKQQTEKLGVGNADGGVAASPTEREGQKAEEENNGEGTRRQERDERFRKERTRKAREQLYFGNEKVEEAVKKSLMEFEIQKGTGIVEVGVVERAEL